MISSNSSSCRASRSGFGCAGSREDRTGTQRKVDVNDRPHPRSVDGGYLHGHSFAYSGMGSYAILRIDVMITTIGILVVVGIIAATLESGKVSVASFSVVIILLCIKFLP